MSYEKIQIVAELYEHVGFGGHKIVLIRDVLDLTAYGFNNKASSIKVFNGPTPEPGWKIRCYVAANHKGPYVDVSPNETIQDLHELKVGDAISSVEFVEP